LSISCLSSWNLASLIDALQVQRWSENPIQISNRRICVCMLDGRTW
jgi:hypothetical protein